MHKKTIVRIRRNSIGGGGAKGASVVKYVRYFPVDSKVRSIPPHECDIRHEMAVDSFLFAKGLVKPVVAGLIARSKLQIFVLSKSFLGRLDTLWVRHVYALRECSNRNVGESLNHLHAGRLVLPVVIVEVAATCHDNGRMGAVVFESFAKAPNVAISVNEPVLRRNSC